MNDDEMYKAFDKIWDKNDLMLLIMLLLAYGNSDGLTKQKAEPKRDCENYYEEHDMGATIPHCKLKGIHEICDCEENCPQYRLSDRLIRLTRLVEGMGKDNAE